MDVHRWSRVRGWLGDAARGAIELVFPQWCPLCGVPARRVCTPCGRRLASAPVERSTLAVRGFDLPVAAVAAPDDLRSLVRQVKDLERFELLPYLASALSLSLVDVCAGRDGVGIVPIPTTRRALRRRGYWPLGLMLCRTPMPDGVVVRLRALTWTRSVRDQRGLGEHQRSRNLAGALRCVDVSLAGRAVIIVDDVVTSGATLRAAAEALLDAGAIVLGAASIVRVQRKDTEPVRALAEGSWGE